MCFHKCKAISEGPTILPLNAGVGTRSARAAGGARLTALTDDVTVRYTVGDVTYYDREHL